MSDDLKDILSNLNNEIEQEKLLDYLNKHMSAQETHDLEKQMVDDEMLDDAMEGLQAFGNKENLPLYVEQLNRELKKQLEKKRARKEKRRWKDKPWIYVAIVVMLILLVVCYFVIRKKIQESRAEGPKSELIISN
jgi:hypothetical protein